MTNVKNHPISYAVNKTVVGKMPANATQDQWRRFNSSFRPVDGTAHSLAVDIWRGWSFTPLYINNRRKKDHFQAAYHIALDFDTMDDRSSIDTLQNEPFSMYASFIYSTPSSQPHAPKSRIVFIFEEPVYEREKYELLYRALLSEYPAADKSTKDAARLFYGSYKCELRPIWSIMNMQTIDNIIGLYQLEETERKSAEINHSRFSVTITPDMATDKDTNKFVEKMIDKVINAPNGQKHAMLVKISYTLGGYAASGYFSPSEAEEWLKSAVSSMNDVKDVNAAHRTISTSVRDGMSKPLVMERRYKTEKGRREVTPI